MKVRTDSWHYQLITNGCSRFRYPDECPTDSCEYISAVLSALGSIVAATIIGSVAVGITLGDFMVWLLVMAMTGTWIDPDPGAGVFIGVVFVCSGVFALYLADGAIKRARQKRREDYTHVPGFVSQAKERLREKYCSAIEVVTVEK